MRPSTIIAVLLAVGALVAFFFVFRQESEPAPKPVAVNVVVAKILIPPYQQITEGMLELKEFYPQPDQPLPPQVRTEPPQVLTRFANREILPGQMIREEFLTQDPNELRNKLTDDFRAFTIPVDESGGVAGYLEAGAIVDLVATFELPDKRRLSKTILQAVTVLAAGEQVQERTSTEGGSVRRYRTVTLQLTPEQVEQVNVLQTEVRRLALSFRSANDLEEVETEGAMIDEFYGDDKTLQQETEMQQMIAELRAQIEEGFKARDDQIIAMGKKIGDLESGPAPVPGGTVGTLPVLDESKFFEVMRITPSGVVTDEAVFEGRDSRERVTDEERARARAATQAAQSPTGDG
jgi:Flp pilus assembly protein CpaB